MAIGSMVSYDLTLTLPDALAQEAEAYGLLTAPVLESLITAEVRHRRIGRLFEAADALASRAADGLTEAEIEAEIQAARDEKREKDAHRR